MMSDVEILLSCDTLHQEKLDSAMNIIKKYDLQLLQEEIMSVFTKARRDIDVKLGNDGLTLYFLEQHQFLFNTLLNTNKNLFVAVTKSHIKGNLFYYSDFATLVCNDGMKRNIGYYYKSINAINIYCKLLDYNDFDIYNLELEKNIKFKIQQYKQQKYGGRFTKAAV